MSAWGVGISLLQVSGSHGTSVAARTLTADGKRVAEEVRLFDHHHCVLMLNALYCTRDVPQGAACAGFQ